MSGAKKDLPFGKSFLVIAKGQTKPSRAANVVRVQRASTKMLVFVANANGGV